MPLLSMPDLIALAFFLGAWTAYAAVIEWSAHGRRGLNAEMDTYRETWMRQMLARQNRIVDTQITASLQNGTAFFASTSLIAIGGALTLLRSLVQGEAEGARGASVMATRSGPQGRRA